MNTRDPFELHRPTAFSLLQTRLSPGPNSTSDRTIPTSTSSPPDRVKHPTSGTGALPPASPGVSTDEMSFSMPQKVPTFDNPQRRFEDTVWASSGTTQPRQSIIANGVGDSLGAYFDRRQLPMYKDKPFAYPASTRHSPLWRRRRTLAAGLGGVRSNPRNVAKSAWEWLYNAEPTVVKWDDRRERVKEAFILSWDSYNRHAWGQDEYHPISKTGRQMAARGLGWIIVDSLDTLMIMNLTSRLSDAREWISTSLTYDQDQEVNTFETTIRMLGGLLSAHYLSTAFPSMAPLLDLGGMSAQDANDLYLEKATDLADRLLGAYDSESGIPYASVNLQSREGIPSHADAGASSTAEAASVQLEMKYIAKLTGEKSYWDHAEKVMQVIDDNGMQDGLLPIFIYASTGEFRGEYIRLGSRGDSYYEYLIKQYLQTSKQEPVYLDMWDQALGGVRKHMITYSSPSNITVLGELPNGIGNGLSPKMDHLVCFMPGTIALGATEGRTEAQAKQSGTWGPKQEEEMQLARELMQTCWGMYKVTATKLAPEIAHFNIYNPPLMEKDQVQSAASLSDDDDAPWRSDYVIKPNDEHNLQRPETVESLFYMWRITGEEQYRQWGWEMFKAFMEYTAVEDGTDFTSLDSVNRIPTPKRDNMESFWLAETLKYFYLLFSPPDLLPLDQIIINTEAHIFPRFELGQLFSTGWKRKPRDADGNIAETCGHFGGLLLADLV
ncbi:MAG: mannosyl-oligosaccharide alpha-1,2-mannosidase [Thelocarpon superellum]|nr:MAG: mannosyl-oligosaccharide alpha-1,2-mannosidase [Thelocarpon superellum]